ncbi:hypothetical protein K2173_007067 [Erythroxylum novogranatense]|uniref:S phase cyclin A-associated protein in the endoplasmic reticulum N-terminal domain-containing protein n=1 Tax=Erythroxylum novogranatense TaxID=1862640 RepID=A0AAV8SKL0_9ROSI|nr:hypothetical protein K2173_007067 [Erythroxylum novogranatense]
MENSGELVDDQGSGWLEVKKKHRSSAKASVRSWAGAFSGKNGSSFQLTQPSLNERSGNMRGKCGSQAQKTVRNRTTREDFHSASTGSSSIDHQNDVSGADNSTFKQDSKGSGGFKFLQSYFSHSNPTVGDSQKLQTDKLESVPKIKWGDLEDDVLLSHHGKSCQGDIKQCDVGNDNTVATKVENFSNWTSSSKDDLENDVVQTSILLDICTDSSTNKESTTEENGKGLGEISAQCVETPAMNSNSTYLIDLQDFKEVKAVDDGRSSSSKSCEHAGKKLEVPTAISDVKELRIAELPVTNNNSVVVLQDSKSLLDEKGGLKIYREAGMVTGHVFPLLSEVDESKISELQVTCDKSDTAMIFHDNAILTPEKTDGGNSRDSETVQAVTCAAKESPISEVPVAVGNLITMEITQDGQSRANEKIESQIPVESGVIALVEEKEGLLKGVDCDELLKVSVLGEDEAAESKERFRERLWCFLFENLNRAVDELYLLCELECDVEQMKEAILVLEEAASDFKELTTRVQEFDNVKRISSQSIDASITLKSDHRRPHALSWEVRRMTTSPHRAAILSSSLEAFKKIQQERANRASSQQLECSNSLNVSADNVNKLSRKSDAASSSREPTVKSRRQSGVSDITQGSINGGRRNLEFERPLSDTNVSKLASRDACNVSGSGKSKRESETEKFLHKKDKTSSENVSEKNSKSTDHLKKQILALDKDREKRNSASWKSLDAWKEKRNWEAILTSPFRVSSRISHSPGISRKSADRARILHDKLMSPEKRKKNAIDLKKEAEEKHARAMRIRNELENERVQKLQRTSEKLNRVNEWQAVRTLKLREGMHARRQRGESRHEAFLAQVVRRAGDESSKVNEVRFITSLNEENKKLMLRQKLQDWELRRAEKLQVMKSKQKEDLAREEAVLERRKLIEAEKLQRLAETQRKKEEAQVRREEERKASSAAREARAIEQLRRREERAKAQQEEAELLAQKLAERLNESEQRRKFYLEQIRERASMDSRDQSSPFLRRSTNKDGQGRSTPTSCEDFQDNGVAGAGGPTVAAGNITLQHSLKRRIKKIRQRLMSLKYEFSEPAVGSENASIGYRTTVGTARAKIGRWLQELQRLRQARKEGAATIGLITAEMIKFLEGKDPELQASRQAGLLDFIASALPASHTSKPEACQVTIHLLKLLRVVLSAPANRSYFLSQNLLPPIVPMLSAALENYIKIAASLNVPGTANIPSSKTSLENFESVSEVLENFLWTVTMVIGHSSSDQRELQMRDGLLELLIAYQVIHRLRDLFALYDRPQVEGSPFPSPIILSIHLLVVLTYRPTSNFSINWEYSSINKLSDVYDFGLSSVNTVSEEYRPPLSILNGSTALSCQDASEDRPVDGSCGVKSNELPSIEKDREKKSNYTSNKLDVNVTDLSIECQKIAVEEKDDKPIVEVGSDHKRNTIPSGKQPKAYLLCAVAETGLVSLPSLLTSVLLQANNRLASEQGSYALPSNFEEVATGVLKVLNNLALLDIDFIQRILARPDLKMELFHLMSFLLSHCISKWKVANDQVGVLLLESLLLLSYFALFHSGNQAVLRWGKSPTILHKVCDLPFVFFSDPELMPILTGTLVAACYGCEQNKDVVLQEISMDMLISLLRSCRNASPTAQCGPAVDNFPTEDSCESNQQLPELKKCQADIPMRSNRFISKTSRVASTRVSAHGNNSKIGKIRCKATKTTEEISSKHKPLVPDMSTMLHSRFPRSFLDKVEQFFSTRTDNVNEI